MTETFLGYRRADGRIGVRNDVAVLSAMDNTNPTAERIAAMVAGTVVALAGLLPGVLVGGKPEAKEPEVPLGLPPVFWPDDNLYTPEKAELGKLLYFDKRLSSDGTM